MTRAAAHVESLGNIMLRYGTNVTLRYQGQCHENIML